MNPDMVWGDLLARDVRHGFLNIEVAAPLQRNPKVVLNGPNGSVLRTLREELQRCESFEFSVAFVSPRAIALLKQELVEFEGTGRIVTSDYLSFNSPEAFAELRNLQRLGIDVRVHDSRAFHPKGYIFRYANGVTAMVGSSNLTANALVQNHEWNLKVSAAAGSDLATQIDALVASQVAESSPLTTEWVDAYASAYVAPAPGANSAPRTTDIAPAWQPAPAPESRTPATTEVAPNRMQEDALRELAAVRRAGSRRAIVISATGTGKTMLSALDVRVLAPRRMLFIAHREQILDRTIEEYRKVLGGPPSDYGKLSGTAKNTTAKYLFATVQTLSQADVLDGFEADEFDYVIVDEAHRAAAESHRRVIAYFRPEFLLGMTATPERPDGFNVFELFDYVVPYEIRLNHGLEEDMLSPFHYYGVADVLFEGGRSSSEVEDLRLLASPARVHHVLQAIETYGQAGVPPRGLIFCSRNEEAAALSTALNECDLRGQRLRTVALSGEDSVAHRESVVRQLERGELDYVLTVDIFNEGVDIPSINQIVMLRQTKSSIVFVQQLGRGLRKAAGKKYLVVIDFIGNYANNYLIPIALFGDESLNKESLRKNLIAAEEAGVLAGMSSVRFDRISQARVLRSIRESYLDSLPNLRAAIVSMRNRLGEPPKLWDFLRFESVDPVVLATKSKNYPELAEKILDVDFGLSEGEHRALALLSHEVLPARRPHEFVLLRALVEVGVLSRSQIGERFAAAGILATERHVTSAIETFTLENHAEVDRKKHRPIVELGPDGWVGLTDDFVASYDRSPEFRAAVDDIVKTGTRMVGERYDWTVPFTAGRQYSRKEVTRLMCAPRKWTSTLYGYKVDRENGMCPIFVTLHKSDEVSASTAYEDALLSPSEMLWYTKSRRTLESAEVQPIVANEVELHVFVKKDDAEGNDFFYLGRAAAHNAEDATMPDAEGKPLSVVRMKLHFEQAIDAALFDYFHPELTA